MEEEKEEQIISHSNEKNIDNKFINTTSKEIEEDIKELKNSRLEKTLSLRKKKLDDYILEKRKKYKNEIYDDDVFVNIDIIKIKVPPMLIEEFDTYEEKLSVIHQFLSDDFTLLHGMDFHPDSVKLYMLYKLNNFIFDENPEFFDDKNRENMKAVFYDIIKIINESKSTKVLFETTAILVNLFYSSDFFVEEFKNLHDIWKRFQEISELKNSEINDNILKIMINYHCNIPNAGKEYILSNYSRYTKQILSNFMKGFDNEIKKEKFNINLFESGIILIKRLINEENKKSKEEKNFDVVVKLKYLYNDLIKIFNTCVSWIINKLIVQMTSSIYDIIYQLLQTFSLIAEYADEETYEMKEFQDTYFVTSLLSLLRIFILNKNKELEMKNTMNILKEIFDFLGKLFTLNSSKTDIYTKNKIIIITEELIKKIGLNNETLIFKIIFFFSNYVDNESRVSEIFENNYLLLLLKEYSNNNINDHNRCNNLFYILDNAFNYGDRNCKEIIINNFTYFLKERIKILSDFVIKNKYVEHFNYNCKLLLSFIVYLEIDLEKYSSILTNLVFFLQNSNLDECLAKVTLNSKNYDHDIVENLLMRLKQN
jgi:hypothetical protein